MWGWHQAEGKEKNNSQPDLVLTLEKWIFNEAVCIFCLLAVRFKKNKRKKTADDFSEKAVGGLKQSGAA